jgi:hypothetical protein
MESKEAFKNCQEKGWQPVAYLLLIFLWRVGKEGSSGGVLSVSSYFGIGKGSVKNYICRYVLALEEIKPHDCVFA